MSHKSSSSHHSSVFTTTNTLLFEIGAEELPHAFIEPAAVQMKLLIQKKLSAAGIDYQDVQSYNTPRRLAVLVTGCSANTKETKKLIKGPLLEAAVETKERFNKIGLGFIQKNSADDNQTKTTVTPSALPIYEVDNNLNLPLSSLFFQGKVAQKNFLYSQLYQKAESTYQKLPALLVEVIKQMTFPKSMRWLTTGQNQDEINFARPIRWLTSLWNDEVVQFTYAGVDATANSSGHGFLPTKKSKVFVKHASNYEAALLNAGVIVDPNKRLANILMQLEKVEANHSIRFINKHNVAKVVNQLVEYPNVLIGKFDEAFLQLPSEVLIAEMVEHQKYFPAENQQGELQPLFAIVSNIEANSTIVQGNQKVLAARLNDAKFLYEKDLQDGFDVWASRLKTTLYEKNLGSYFDKSKRHQKIVEQLLTLLNADSTFSNSTVAESNSTSKSTSEGDEINNWLRHHHLDKAIVEKAIRYQKSDLLSRVVFEFPHLQGTMGYYYAKQSQWSEKIALAFKEQYQPHNATSTLPTSALGTLLSLVDRLDAVLGCFAVNLLPTGSTDPYALRRHGQAIIRLAMENHLPFDLQRLLDNLIPVYHPYIEKTKSFATAVKWKEAVLAFFTSRLKTTLKDYQLANDELQAAIGGQGNHHFHFYRLHASVLALREWRKTHPDNFSALILVAKRVRSILSKATEKSQRVNHVLNNKEDASVEMVQEKWLEKQAEIDLYAHYQKHKHPIEQAVATYQYQVALELLFTFCKIVDDFFDTVYVNADNKNKKTNRLALIGHINDLFCLAIDLNAITA